MLVLIVFFAIKRFFLQSSNNDDRANSPPPPHHHHQDQQHLRAQYSSQQHSQTQQQAPPFTAINKIYINQSAQKRNETNIVLDSQQHDPSALNQMSSNATVSSTTRRFNDAMNLTNASGMSNHFKTPVLQIGNRVNLEKIDNSRRPTLPGFQDR